MVYDRHIIDFVDCGEIIDFVDCGEIVTSVWNASFPAASLSNINTNTSMNIMN